MSGKGLLGERHDRIEQAVKVVLSLTGSRVAPRSHARIIPGAGRTDRLNDPPVIGALSVHGERHAIGTSVRDGLSLPGLQQGDE